MPASSSSSMKREYVLDICRNCAGKMHQNDATHPHINQTQLVSFMNLDAYTL
jgi:hypothetical protein